MTDSVPIIDEEIDTIVADRLHVDRSIFDDESELKGEELGAESLDVVEIAEAIDEELGVYVTMDELETIATVGDFKSFVRENLDDS